MEILQTIGTSILSTIVEDLVKSTGRHVSYIFHFKGIIEDLKKETENLRSKLEHMQHRVDGAIRDTEEIEEDVQKWLRDVADVVADIEKMEKESREKQTCLNGWCPNWMWKYQLAKKAEKKKKVVLKLEENGKFNNISHRATLPSENVFSQKDFVPFESNQRSFDQIIEALKGDKTNVVGLYGMGGVGKTTLAKAMANKTREENIFNKVIMVVVSQNPNIKSIQGHIADFLNFKLDEESIAGRAERLSMRLKNEKKILIILDDIWFKLDLTSIGIPVDDHHKDCKIFLTTRRQQVCIDMGCQIRIPLDVLNDEEGLLLLKRQAGLNDDFPTLIQLAKEVANECKGLPLAIVAVGSALKEKSTDEWKIMIQTLKKSKLTDVDTVDADVYACLKLSYDYLKDQKTKLCFLLCSLFPEDHKIDMEELLRYGLGLGWYQYTDSIEDTRTELRVMVNNLKASSLLLDANEGFVKMHDVVRDVALWIASKGEYIFMAKAGIGLTEWPKHEGLEQCTAISLIENEIKVLPDDLVCPKLLILLLGSYSVFSHISEICENFFEEMKALKVVTLVRRKLSLKSLQSLTNLVTLQLINCEIRDISSLKKLAKLEILSLQGSMFEESLEELKELSKLRMLDLNCCYIERIPVDVISRLSQLEQLHIISSGYESQKVEGTNAERSSASLFELNKLYCLTILSLAIIGYQRLPKDFILLKKLLKYDIRVNCYGDSSESNPKSRRLAIKHMEGTSLFAFKPLYENVEYLQLYDIKGCCQNIVPDIDQTGLNELKRLSLKQLQEMECIIDITQQHVPPVAFSNLVHLSLHSVDLREICTEGRPPRGFLGSLETLQVEYSKRMSRLFPTLLCQRLQKLREVTINHCDELQDVFQLEGLCYTKENLFLRSSLASLHLSHLPNPRYVQKGPIQQVSLQSLTVVEVGWCNKLRYIFTLNLAQSFLQLQQLKVKDCDSLEHIIKIKAENNVAARDGNIVVLPKLRILQLLGLGKLINFYSKNYNSTWPALQELILDWTPSLVAEFGANLQAAKETLRVLKVHNSDGFCEVVTPQLKKNFEMLEKLEIGYSGGVQVIFQLEKQLSLSSLKEVRLHQLPELESLYKGPAHLLSLPNVQQLQVSYCKSFRHHLSSTLARNLRQLKKISVWNCGELEQVMVEDDREDHVQLPLFPNLSSIYVSDCEKLKALFRVTTARLDLQQLTSLTIDDSPQLEEIFGHKDEADMTADTELELVLPQLKELKLDGLESLVNFCPSGYHLIFPSLSKLWVVRCPKITTGFSVDQNGAVHAQAEAPHTLNRHVVDMEHSPSETANEIVCWDSKDLRQKLAPYNGK